MYREKKEVGVMKIAVVGAQLRKRNEIATELAKKYDLPIITEQIKEKELHEIIKKGKITAIKPVMDSQIKNQILLKDGFISDGCTLDYIVIAKIVLKMSDRNISEIPELLKARLHTIRQIEKIVYIPLQKNDSDMLLKYDTYLKKELDLVSNKIPVSIKNTLDRAIV